MANKNIPRKSVCSHLLLEASMCESHPSMQESEKPVVLTKLESFESYIMTRRPTKLSLELLSRAKEARSLPEAEESNDVIFGGGG
jgi:hypothetical protein